MSMKITYTRLFNLRLRHAYFKDGKARGLHLMPLNRTTQLLRKGRMLMKELDGLVITSYRAEDDEVTPLINLGSDVELQYGLAVDNLVELVKLTDLDTATKSYENGAFLMFENDPAAASIDPDNPEALTLTVLDGLRPELFTYQVQLTTPPTTLDLTVTDENGTAVSVGLDHDSTPLPTTVAIEANDNDVFSQQIDLRKKDGIYAFTWRDGATVVLEETFYLSNELSASAFPALIRLRYNDATDHIYGDTEEYVLNLQVKSTHWKYFVVDKHGKVDMQNNSIVLTDTTGAAVSPYPNVAFNLVGGAIPHPTIQVQGQDTAVFASDQPLPFFEAPKLNIEIREQDLPTTDKLLIENAPNPTVFSSVKEDGGLEHTEILVFV